MSRQLEPRMDDSFSHSEPFSSVQWLPEPSRPNAREYHRHRSRRLLTTVACSDCRRRKVKCDGQKPVCGACVRRKNPDCVYDWQNRSGALRVRNLQLQEELDRLRHKGPGPDTDGHYDNGLAIPSPALSPHDAQLEFEKIQAQARQMKVLLRVLARASNNSAADDLVHEIDTNGVSPAAFEQAYTMVHTPELRNELLQSQAEGDRVVSRRPQAEQQEYGNLVSPSTLSDPARSTQEQWMSNALIQQADDDGTTIKFEEGNLVSTGHPPFEPRRLSHAEPLQHQPLQHPKSSQSMSEAHALIATAQLDDDSSNSSLSQTSNAQPMYPRTPAGFGNLPLSSSIRTNNYPELFQRDQIANISLPAYAAQPMWMRGDTVVTGSVEWANRVMVAFFAASQAKIQQGVPAQDIIGPSFPATMALTKQAQNSDLSLTTSISDFVCRFMVHYEGSPSNRIGAWLISFLYWRWQIVPTPEHYEAMPHWLRPRPAQNFVPHMPSVGPVVWPEIRELLVANPLDFVPTIMNCFSVNWPWSETDIFATDSTTGGPALNPTFLEWCLDIKNWSLDRAALKTMPLFDGKASMH